MNRMTPIKTKTAAELLNEVFPKSVKSWIQFLKNNRRYDRNPIYKIPFTNINGDAYYLKDDLNKFVNWEKHRIAREISNNRYAGMQRFIYEQSVDEYGFISGTDFSVTRRVYNGKPYVDLSFNSARVTFKLSLVEVEKLIEDLKGSLDHETR